MQEIDARIKFAASNAENMPEFILNDETKVNSHGFAVLNKGGKLDRFRDNPVMLHNHNSANVIGKWNNLRLSGNNLVADPEFDKEDQDAVKVQGKVDRGYLKGASMGIIILNAAYLPGTSGKEVLTVTEWELLEASIVSVPSNAGSLRVFAADGITELDADNIQLSLNDIVKPTFPKMDKINLSADAAKALGIPRDPEAAELNAAVMELSAKLESEKQARLNAEKAKGDAEKVLNDHKVSLATKLVDDAVTAGKITADKKESYVKMATADFAQAKDVLDSLPGKQTMSAQVNAGEKGAPEREGWTYLKYLKEAPKELEAMKANDPDKFEALRKAAQ